MRFHFLWFYSKKRKRTRGGPVAGKSTAGGKRREEDGMEGRDRERMKEFKQYLFPGRSIVAAQSSL